uniref:Cupin n=1 Tax=Candidatus Kentrum sp. FM TaxID=2126340 RepID=A0A450T5P8_9GAMM|nr:MAG: Cupin [Candidatus Kentron sp. FM]VFJ61768.1 MAG: Cupin [Candidatus Kentron sp. FM]VFK13552.1 MAG: Cupin [Candidatus Kentron sp. FM]
MRDDSIHHILRNREGLTIEKLREAIETRWNRGGHFETADKEDIVRDKDYEHIPWEKVDCMLTKMVETLDNGITFAFDMFPPQSAAKADLHIHPISDRIITIVNGTGHAFVRTANGSVDTKPVGPGDVILFPQGTPHCFWGSEEDPMTVQVVLNPYIPLEHPLHTVCSKKIRNLSDHPALEDVDRKDLDALTAIVTRLVEQGELDLGERQYMDWGDEVVKASAATARKKIMTPDDSSWECEI